jgi:hypothetical protein
MTGATVGVAALGAAYALMHGGPAGLRVAMLVGGGVQLASAAAAWINPARPVPHRSDPSG